MCIAGYCLKYSFKVAAAVIVGRTGTTGWGRTAAHCESDVIVISSLVLCYQGVVSVLWTWLFKHCPLLEAGNRNCVWADRQSVIASG